MVHEALNFLSSKELLLANLSIIAGLLGAGVYFFGSIIPEAGPRRYGKIEIYSNGSIFLLIYLILPATLVYWFNLLIPSAIGFLAQASLLVLLSVGWWMEFINQAGADGQPTARQDKGLQRLRNRGQHIALKFIHVLKFWPLGNLILFGISVLNLAAILNSIHERNYLNFVATLAFAFLTLMTMALTLGILGTRRPEVEIKSKNGDAFRGTLLKEKDRFFVLRTRDLGLVWVNVDEISRISFNPEGDAKIAEKK